MRLYFCVTNSFITYRLIYTQTQIFEDLAACLSVIFKLLADLSSLGKHSGWVCRSRWLSGRASASGWGGRWFEFRPRHSKAVKMVPVATLLDAQHYKASTGFSSLNTYRTTNFTSLAKINMSAKKSDNQCLYSPEDRMEY